MAVVAVSAGGASVSSGSGSLGLILYVAGAGASSSASALAYLHVVTGVQVTQAGLGADARAEERQVTQAGLGADARAEERQVTQVGLQVDGRTTVDRQVTQAGLGVDAGGEERQVTQVGLMVDARYNRPQSTVNCWEFHVLNRAGTYLAFLDGAFGKAYRAQLNDVGGGSFQMSASDPKATGTNLAVGNIVLVRYRNVDVGAFLIEEVDEALVAQDEEPGRVVTVSGRGLLALLENGVVYPSDLGDATTVERAFSGVSRAEILLTLYDEFQVRGGGDLTPDFSATVDSDGAAWTDSNTLNFKAGKNLLEVARELAGLGMDIGVDPDRTLRAWYGAGQDRSREIVFEEGRNLLQLTRTQRGQDLANAVLAEGQGLLSESTDSTSIANRGRREAYLPVRNSANSTQVATAAGLLLAEYKDPLTALTLTVAAHDLFPLLDYELGDTVKVTARGDELAADYRALAVSIRERGTPCDLEVQIEVNSLALEYLIKLHRAFEASMQNVPVAAGAASQLAAGDTRVGAVAGHTHTESDISDLDHDAVKIQGRSVASDAPTDGDVLTWDAGASEWAPAAVGGSSTWDFLNSSKAAADTPDDEFAAGTLAGKWTAVSGSAGTVSLIETSNVQKYDLASRSGWLLMQAGPASGQEVLLRQDWTLGDGESIIAALGMAITADAFVANNELRIVLGLNDNDSDFDSAGSDYQWVGLDAELSGFHVIHFTGSTLGDTYTNSPFPGSMVFVRIQRDGLDYYAFCSADGGSWAPLGKFTRGAAADNLWLVCQCAASYTGVVPVAAVKWIRQGGAGIDPW